MRAENSQLESEFDALSIYVANIFFGQKRRVLVNTFFKGLKMLLGQQKIGIFRSS